MVDVIRLIKAGKKVVAWCARDGRTVRIGYHHGELARGLKAAGFADMVEVALGGDMTAAYEAEEWQRPTKRERR